MDRIVSNSISKTLEKNGQQIYSSNNHLRKLANIMEHPEFRDFYNEYMQDWDKLKLVIMFMKIYEAIEKHSKIELTPYQKVSILKEMIDNKETREKICQGISNWIKESENKKLSLTQEESIITTSS